MHIFVKKTHQNHLFQSMKCLHETQIWQLYLCVPFEGLTIYFLFIIFGIVKVSYTRRS